MTVHHRPLMPRGESFADFVAKHKRHSPAFNLEPRAHEIILEQVGSRVSFAELVGLARPTAEQLAQRILAASKKAGIA